MKQINIRLSDELHQKLRLYAAQHQLNNSQIISAALQKLVRK